MKAFTLVSSALFVTAVSAVKFPVRRSTNGLHAGGISKPKIAFSSAQGEEDEIVVDNHQDAVYTTVAKLGGKEYKLQLDTGSSDLWVYSPTDPVPSANKTDYEASVQYGKGKVQGYIEFAEFEFGDYKVPSQAFINVDKTADLEVFEKLAIKGILGLSFDSSSEVDQVIKQKLGKDSTLGRGPISNIFHQNPSLPNFISVLLGRTGDLDDEVEGMFTIAEYVEEFKAVQNEPKLPRRTVNTEGAMARWNAEVEGITVNGASIQLISEFPGGKDGSVVALLDTGYTYPPVDTYIADAIYSSIPGAVKAQNGLWVVPCLNSTELSFKLGGKDFPIHPLDLTTPQIIQGPDGEEYTVCINNFQAKDDLPDIDMILGDAFLRNVYAIFDWGNESDGGNESPFMQLLSTTTWAEAIPEFLHSRTESLKSLPMELPPAELLARFGETPSKTPASPPKGNNSTSSTGNSSGTNGQNNFSAASAADDDSKFDELMSKIGGYGPVIVGLLAANLLFVLILTAMGVYLCLRRRGKAKTVNTSYVPVKLKDSDNHSGFSTSYNTPYNA